MIVESSGNLLKADAEALVNTVNCVGVMGKGIALQFKQAYPEMNKAYAKACDAGDVVPGRMMVWMIEQLNGPRFVINFPTKRHWVGRSSYADIRNGLIGLVAEVRKRGIRSIAIPPLGCGHGGLSWAKVRPLIEDAFVELPDVRVLLYLPAGEPSAADRIVRTPRPAMTRARALFLAAMNRYAVLAYETTQLEIQKLGYFLQEDGEPLRLNYSASHYGPYADNLNKVMEQLAGHHIDGFTGDRKPDQIITLRPGAAEEATIFLANDEPARQRIERLSRLIEGFETPYGVELLSTVHWVAHHGEPNTETVIAGVHAWSDRKKRLMTDAHIRIAYERLLAEGWLTSIATVPS